MIFDSVACDWMSFRHEYAEPVKPLEAGRVMRLDADGVIEWESPTWSTVRCPSSDTSLRIKCDGQRLYGSANIGRFQQPDNRLGLTVIECVERWAEVLEGVGLSLHGFGTRDRVGTPAECGTYLTRIDLAGNVETSDYAALCHAVGVRRIGQKLPMVGRYGPTWGYDAKRGNWWKAKLYDKTAELAGKRRSEGGATLARFEVQLGSEWLRQNNLDAVIKWKGDDMEKIVYGKFADAVFRDSVSVENWSEIPARLRQYAVLWRDGVDVRTVCSVPTYYRVRTKLREYGIDIGTPCNVMALTRVTRAVEIRPVPALRRDALRLVA